MKKSNEISKKTETELLKEYEARSLVVRSIVALGCLVITGVLGLFGTKRRIG